MRAKVAFAGAGDKDDQMVRPKFMAKPHVFHIKETKHVVQDANRHVDLVRE